MYVASSWLPLRRAGTVKVVEVGPVVGMTGVNEPLGGIAVKLIVAVLVPVS